MSAYNVKAHPAFAGYDLGETNGAMSSVRRLVAKVATWREARRLYNETYAELEVLSDRELNDIGISRFEIPAVAREAAKHAARA
jgi:uncharacterized protein YjiS (DUF1127 family)